MAPSVLSAETPGQLDALFKDVVDQFVERGFLGYGPGSEVVVDAGIELYRWSQRRLGLSQPRANHGLCEGFQF